MSPQHRRHASVAELVELLAPYSHLGYVAGKRATGTESRRSESGEEVMVPFEQLSEASKDISRAAAAAMLDGLAQLGVPVEGLVKITANESVNLEERPEDAARRFAGQLLYAEELIKAACKLFEGTPSMAAVEWVERAQLFPHKPEEDR